MFKKKVMVAEPWDFVSSDGNNLMYVVINKVVSVGLIVSATSSFNMKTEPLLFERRNNDDVYNIYALHAGADIDNLKPEDVDFICIGTSKSLRKSEDRLRRK